MKILTRIKEEFLNFDEARIFKQELSLIANLLILGAVLWL